MVLDAPVYFESGLAEKYVADGVLVITLPEELQLKRLKERNNLTDAEAESRIKSQMSLTKKRKWLIL